MFNCNSDQSIPKRENRTPGPGAPSDKRAGGPMQEPKKERLAGGQAHPDSQRAALPGSTQLGCDTEAVTGDHVGIKSEGWCDKCLRSPVPTVTRCLSCHFTMCTQHLQLHERNEAFQQSFAEVGLPLCLNLDLREEKGTGPSASKPMSTCVAQLRARQQLAEALLQRERDRETTVRVANTRLREKAGKLLDHMTELVRAYGVQVMGLIEAELCPQEESLHGSTWRVAGLQQQLEEVRLRATAAMDEEDETLTLEQLESIQAQVVQLVEQPLEGAAHVCLDTACLCASLEAKNAELRAALGAAQRGLRSVLNPSEVTLDANTVHPSLVLSEDLRTVVYSTAKQLYPQHPDRFVSFLQVLSSQGFSGGQHRWQVEAEGCQWVLGVCYRSLARVGLPSALESSSGSWCLMWCDNLLRAYSQGRDTPLLRTITLRRLEIQLDYEAGSLTFYSANDGTVHLHTFKTTFTDPVYLAFRMMSCQNKSRITLIS